MLLLVSCGQQVLRILYAWSPCDGRRALQHAGGRPFHPITMRACGLRPRHLLLSRYEKPGKASAETVHVAKLRTAKQGGKLARVNYCVERAREPKCQGTK